MSTATDNTRWVWMDLEMTGLDDQTCVVVQAAMIITDGELNELDSTDLVIWQPESALERMGPFVRKMHTDNGLLDRIRASEKDIHEVEDTLLKMLSKHVPYKTGILAGNSIWQDRRFLLRYMPHLENALHYRMIDVSSIKVLSNQWYGDKGAAPKGTSSHTALEDIRASIEELKFYREKLFKSADAV